MWAYGGYESGVGWLAGVGMIAVAGVATERYAWNVNAGVGGGGGCGGEGGRCTRVVAGNTACRHAWMAHGGVGHDHVYTRAVASVICRRVESLCPPTLPHVLHVKGAALLGADPVVACALCPCGHPVCACVSLQAGRSGEGARVSLVPPCASPTAGQPTRSLPSLTLPVCRTAGTPVPPWQRSPRQCVACATATPSPRATMAC